MYREYLGVITAFLSCHIMIPIGTEMSCGAQMVNEDKSAHLGTGDCFMSSPQAPPAFALVCCEFFSLTLATY